MRNKSNNSEKTEDRKSSNKQNKTIIIILCIIVCLALIGGLIVFYFINNKNKFLTEYEWKSVLGSVDTIKFNKDGTGKYENYDMNYLVKDKIIEITFKSSGKTRKFKLNEDKTKIENIEDEIKVQAESKKDFFIKNDSLYENNKKTIREELIKNTPQIDLFTLFKEESENPAKSSLKYNNNLFKVELDVTGIKDNHILSSIIYPKYGFCEVRVWLPIEEIAKLDRNKKITLIGSLTNVGSNIGGSISIEDAFIIDIKEQE